MSDLAFTCPKCNKSLSSPEELLGKTVECPNCQTQIILPEPVQGSQIEVCSLTLSDSQSPFVCPLCGKSKHMHKPKVLYNHVVCKKCHHGFAERRRLAFLLDYMCLNLFAFVAVYLTETIMAMAACSRRNIDIIGIVSVCIIMALFFVKDGLSGYSPGKFACGVRVINEKTGKSIGLGGSLTRTFPMIFPIIPLVIAYQLSDGHRFGDGNTKVIWNKYAEHPLFGTYRIDN